MASPSSHRPHILGVNPWIHDFAAYDFWSRPLGLLSLLAVLRAHDFPVSYIDCTDRFHPRMPEIAPQAQPGSRQGRGPYRKTQIAAPSGLEYVPRRFSRYGIDPDWLRDDLQSLPTPDLVLVTSIMTYWYPGVEETIGLIRQIFPKTPIVLGGVYARLCTDHARTNSAADHIAAGFSEKNILDLVADLTGCRVNVRFDPEDMDTWPWPAHDLQHRIACVPLLTSRGCPFNCPYCAARFLEPTRSTRSPENVAAEITHWHKTYGVRDFVFYDDALLVDSARHFIPLAEQICVTLPGLRFHTPNALHIREINEETARWMADCGFKTIRLGLETAAFANRETFDNKVTRQEFERAVTCLKAAGFTTRQIGAYVLTGLPDQSLDEVVRSLEIVVARDITPIPAYYTPIPHTALWGKAVACSPYDLASDPVFTNNALFPCRPEGFSWEIRARLKHSADRTEK